MDYSVKEDTIEYIFEKIEHLILPSESNNYKSRFLQSNALLYCVVLLLVLKIVTVLISINLPQNIFFADITKSVLENSVNQTRQSLGLQPLVENQKLDQAAQLKAENMVQYQYFDHTSPTGISPWFWFAKAGYSYKYAGENLAIGFYDSEEVYNAWLNSPEHKANIVNPNYTEVGTAVLSGFGPNDSIVVVQEFASPSPVKQVVASNGNAKPAAAKTKTQPATATAEPSTSANVTPQAVNPQVSIASPNVKGANSLPAKVSNFVLYNYTPLLQDIIYGVSLIVIGILITLIFFNFNITLKKQLVFRAVLVIILLSAATLLNKEIIISLIPHKILI